MKNLIITFLLCCATAGVSQPLSNTQILQKTEFKNQKLEYKYKAEYAFKNKNWCVKYNPISLFFGGALFFYQSSVATQLAANCPHEISCSNFSKQVINRYGIIKGIVLTADRLTRCTALGKLDLNKNTDIDKKTGKIIDNPEQYKLKDKIPAH